MRIFKNQSLADLFQQIRGCMAAVVAMLVMLSCGSDPAGGNNNGNNSGGGNGGNTNDEYTDGVILPSTTSLSCDAGINQLQIVFTAEKGYVVEVSDNKMVEIVEGTGSAAVGGRYVVKFDVMSNPQKEARNCTVLVTVDGYKAVELCQIKQKAGSGNKVNEWIATRLNNEYLWLDEYRQMGHHFDYTLGYSDFLDKGLKLMETNYMDGKTTVRADGSKERSLYSYIMQESSVRSTRAEATMTTGFGIDLIPVAWGDQDTGMVYFIINHVYPGSPADMAGLSRGDIVLGIDGSRVNNLNYATVYNQITTSSSATIKIEKTLDRFAFDPKDFKSEEVSLQKGAYYENPVGYSAVLDLSEYEELQPLHNRKIGYISYLAFEYDYEQQLISAIKDFADKGVTDIIIDLRTNGGGSVAIAQEFVSMVLPESYVGQTVCTLMRNPLNTVATAEEKNEKIPVVNNDSNGNDLPNLNLDEVWFIASNASASASELMIKGFEGLDIKTRFVGVPTKGKNTGMDVLMRYPIDGKYYTFAPITFLNANAKGDSDYYDGIQPEVNLSKFITEASSEVVRDWANYFADKTYTCPDAEWGDFVNDLALREVLMQMMGKSMKDADLEYEEESEPTASTRSGAAKSFSRRTNLKPEIINVFNPKEGTQFVREHYNKLMDAQ